MGTHYYIICKKKKLRFDIGKPSESEWRLIEFIRACELDDLVVINEHSPEANDHDENGDTTLDGYKSVETKGE